MNLGVICTAEYYTAGFWVVDLDRWQPTTVNGQAAKQEVQKALADSDKLLITDKSGFATNNYLYEATHKTPEVGVLKLPCLIDQVVTIRTDV